MLLCYNSVACMSLGLLVVDYLEFRGGTIVVWYLLLMLSLACLLFSFNLGVLVVS